MQNPGFPRYFFKESHVMKIRRKKLRDTMIQNDKLTLYIRNKNKNQIQKDLFNMLLTSSKYIFI